MLAWHPGEHMLVKNETIQLLQKGLETVKSWRKGWKPRYFLIDNSLTGKGAIKGAFKGI